MTHLMRKLLTYRVAHVSTTCAACEKLFERHYSDETVRKPKPKEKHPYKNIHPWKSKNEFSKFLLDNIIYNKDGIVVLNKPYGISVHAQKIDKAKKEHALCHLIVNPVDYTISSCLPEIAETLGYSNLSVVKSPERYMTGATMLVAKPKLEEAVQKAVRRALAFKHIYRTFWVVTTMVPHEIRGKKQLALQLKRYPHGEKKAVILEKWSESEHKKQKIKILNVEFEVLSNSTLNLSSLLQIKSSTQHWHAVRAFAAMGLFSPVLGDNYYGPSIQKVMDTWFTADSVLPEPGALPKLNKELLKLLRIQPSQQEIIPAHVHLRSIYLPSLFGKGEDFVVDAPLLPPFSWTCKQLQFKYLMNMEKETSEANIHQQIAAC